MVALDHGRRSLPSANAAAQEIDAPEEVGDEGRRRTAVDFWPCSQLHDNPTIHHRNPVGKVEGLFLVVCDIDRRDPELTLNPDQFKLHGLAQLQIECSERLIHQQDFGWKGERARERDALALAAGQLVRKLLGLLEKRTSASISFDAANLFVGRGPALAKSEGHVLGHREVREERVVLKHHSDAPVLRPYIGHVAPVDRDPAMVRTDQPGHQPQGGRLAAAGRAEQRQEFAVPNLAGQIVYGDERAVALGNLCRGRPQTSTTAQIKSEMIARLRVATRAFGTAAGLSVYSIRQDGDHVYRAAPRLKNLSDATTCAP